MPCPATGLRVVLMGAAMLAAGPAWAAEPAASCNGKGLMPAQIRCFLAAAEAADDVGLCERADAKAVRFNCISLFAERSGRPAACQRIAVANRETQALRDACIAGVAGATGRPELCTRAKLSSVRDACYVQLVVRFGADPALCARIERAAMRKVCAAAASHRK